MNFEQVETEVKKLSKKVKKESFVYDFLAAFGTAKSTITMLKNGSRNLSKKENEIICKKKILFSSVEENVEQYFKDVIADKASFKHDPRFIVVTDYKDLFALDTKLMDKIDFKVKDIHKKFDFFLPLAGIEKKEFQHENPVDVKAAEKLAKLFDLIKADNPKSDEKSLHSLNVFLTRLLFCYFAEDTDIFPKGLFSGSVASHTQLNGSDLSLYLSKIFSIMNIEKRVKDTPDYLKAFPYVNGGLFAEEYPIPKFTKRSREALLDISDLDWAEINPDIFGSMIQAVVHPEQRAGLGMHYTSVSNIMKVIEPLFLIELKEEFKKSKDNIRKLKKLLQRICELKVFDPACGSGNFLIIAFKELRLLEMEILKQLEEIPLSGIQLSNFYGIEIDDFAHEVAKLSLWLADHQMNLLFKNEFGESKPSLPLKETGNIVCENSVTFDWNILFPENNEEVFIIGNPPYVGSKVQSKEQKEEVKETFNAEKGYKSLDYITCWFIKASKFIQKREKSQYAFVSTNSITQGEQVRFWKYIGDLNQEIHFCYPSFKWSNSAKGNAGVTCIIAGVRNKSSGPKYIYENGMVRKAKNINYYLADAPNVVIERRAEPISSQMPLMLFGSIAYDGGHLFLSDSEKIEVCSKYPGVDKYIRRAMGTNEMLKGIKRWCLWINESNYEEAIKNPYIKKQLNKVVEFRESSKTPSTQAFADRPYRFKQYTYKETNNDMLIIPRVSSERREYLPLDFQPCKTVTVDAQVIYSAPLYLFGIISSKIHMLWIKSTSGQLETRIRYSSAVSYNNFPLPVLSEKQMNELSALSMAIIAAREKNNHLTIAKQYDPDKMPDQLRQAHQELDNYFESCLQKDGFQSDSDRLSFLFSEYKRQEEI